MIEIIKDILWVILSVLLIGKGSDWFTDALIPIARKLGTSTVSIGLILVSVAVSLPEVLTAVSGVLKGYPTISFGVTVGSIACNIGLMIGFSALVRPLKVTNVILLRDGIFSIIVPVLIFAVAAGGQITKIEGFAFFLLFIPYVINVFLQERSDPAKKEKVLKNIEIELDLLGFSFAKIQSPWAAFVLGLFLLLAGANIFTNQLINFSRQFNVDERLIGMTLGAIGPTIPNIVAAYQATKKGMTDVAVSETLGANVFTLLVTLGILAFLSPIEISQKSLIFDIPAIIVMSFMLFIFMFTDRVISRAEGLILFFTYVLFLAIQIIFNI